MKTTFRSKLLIAALISLMTAGVAHATSTAAASAPALESVPGVGTVPNATAPAHVALAQTYINSVPVEDDIKAAVEEMAKRVPSDQRVLFRSIADKSIDYAKLKSAAVQQIAYQFTDDEIKAMTKFFSSPEGKSIRRKLPAYEASMQPAMVDALQGFVVKLKENNVAVDVDGTHTQ